MYFARLLRIIGLLVLASLVAPLAGCSAVKLGYESATELAYWRIDGYLDLDDNQSPRVREALAQLHRWHRAQELPQYAVLLAQAGQLVAGEFTADQACGLLAQARARLDALAAQAEPDVVALAMTLTPRQLRHLERRQARDAADDRKDWLDATPAEREDRRYRQWLDRAEMVYGRLDDAQRALLRRELAASSFDPRLLVAERQRRRADLMRVLREVTAAGVAVPAARDALRGWLARSTTESPDPLWRQAQERMQRDGCGLVAALQALATPAQREVAARRLRAYERDARELAAR